jgi:myo-inositol-1(or 4)-monophosphatase
MTDLEQRLAFAGETARSAGALALDYFKDFASLTVKSKGVQDMASEADVQTENFIRGQIQDRYPGDAFLGEEGAATFALEPGKGTWIVDPIDGTQPFVSGIPSWCISIAYVELTALQVGAVFDPVADELFAAGAGLGATLNGRAIQCSQATSLTQGLVSVGFSNRVEAGETLEPLGRLMRAGGMYHRNGSGALSLAYVGAGRLIGYFEPHMNSWDFAAGALIVREAGGRTNDCLPSEQAILDGGPVIAAGTDVYEQLAAVILGSG